MKPLRLIKYLCSLTKTPTGGTVMDPYAGTGTTAIACMDTGRDYIVIESDKNLYSEMKTRVESYENI